MPRIAASIVTYNTDSDELDRCLQSLSPDIFSEIFIIDNSRSHTTRSFCDGRKGIRYIASDNVGYGAAHNQAIRLSLKRGYEYHLVLNSDVWFDRDSIEPLLRYMESHPDTAALQPRIVDSDGRLQYTARMLPTPADLILRRFLPSSVMRGRRMRYELRHIDHDKEFDAPYLQGSFMLMRSEALRIVGLFDERFFMYPEDIDLTRRLHRYHRTMYVPLVTIVHAHRAESYKNFRMLCVHIVNMIRYFNKWGWIFDTERRRVNRTLHPHRRRT